MSDEQRTSGTNPGENNANGTDNVTRLISHVRENKVDVALWGTRTLTIIFALGYVLPIFGSAQNYYNKVLLANAATSALRLHQRLSPLQFSREYLSRLIFEDSCHYLFYSIIFFYVSPIFLVLVPVVLFAVLHASSYSLKLLDVLGQNSWWLARLLISIVEFQTTNILRLAALNEIFIMPLTVILIFTGKAGLMTTFLYYHFLVMRYMSRRNPYTRNAFSELRIATEGMAQKSPAIVAKILRAGISFVSRFAPPQTPMPAPRQ